MAKKKSYTKLLKGITKPMLLQCMSHYLQWNEDNDNRRTRKNGWNDITDGYWGKLPIDWPYNSKVIDPCIRTSLIEKDSRLLNKKLRGRLIPREGGDVLKARLNNAMLDFQWDNANKGGSMLEKLYLSSQDTRLYATKFAYVPWLYECDDDGEVLFNGNEMIPLDIRDCGMDPTATHIRDAKWFQHRSWTKIEDLEKTNDVGATHDVQIYPGLSELLTVMAEGHSDRRDTAYENRILGLKGLQDRVGDDKSFPIVEIVTEYRIDKWVTFAPRYKVILREIDNPYNHHKIPISQLRYYAIQGDPLGESEVEPVLPLWKAIQATLCGYLDSYNIHIRPPLKVLDGQARIETIVYGPEAIMLMDRPDAVTEFQSGGEAIQYFQATYQALKSAFNTAMGDISQGVSAVDPTNNKKTATEINTSARQQLTRDQKNQNSLSEFLQDIMSMWLSNNKQFLFSDPDKKEFVLRIVGSDLFNYFQRAGLDDMEVTPEAMQTIGDIISQQGGNMSDEDINALYEAGKTPKHPVFSNLNEKDPAKLDFKPKMRVNDMGDGAEISLMPEDLDGNYDYIPDIKSMEMGAGDEMIKARQNAIERNTNPQIIQQLAQEGVRPKIKDMLIADFEDSGMRDAERFYETISPDQNPAMNGQMGGQPGQAQPDMNQIIQQGAMPPQPMQPPQMQ